MWVVIDTFRKDNQITPLPFDFANKLKTIGWKLQDIIIWNKTKTVPWSKEGQTKKKFEYILFFSKKNKFKYRTDRVREYDTKFLKKWWIKYPERYNPKGKSPEEVWNYDIPVQGSWGDGYIKHFCPLPTDMIGKMINLTSDEGDVVLDPFAGSGSVLAQAAYMKRKYVGFELNKEYIQMFLKYLDATYTKGRKNYLLLEQGMYSQGEFSATIIKLRVLKYARILKRQIKEKYRRHLCAILVELQREQQLREGKVAKVKYIIAIDEKKVHLNHRTQEELQKECLKVTNVPPLSKFGIDPTFSFIAHSKLDLVTKKTGKLYTYTDTTTHKFKSKFQPEKVANNFQILSSIKVNINEKDFE